MESERCVPEKCGKYTLGGSLKDKLEDMLGRLVASKIKNGRELCPAGTVSECSLIAFC